LHIRVGDIAAAREYLEEAKRLYASVRDQPRRTIAQFTDGQLLREGGELPAAASTFEQVVIEARELGRPWLEAAALAAAALVRLHLRHAGAEGYAERANEIVAQFADDRWFAGREFLDALNIRLALSGGHAGLAIETFNGAAEALERRDVYAACWLAAETAPLLLADGITAVQATVAHLRRRAQRHGFTRVAARYPR
jgi:hypothetical protein